jgi:hypothetical protein
MKHAWGGKEYHWLVSLNRFRFKLLYMTEIKHVLLNESIFNFFVCPVYKQFIVEICFFCKATTKKDWVLEICTIPVGFKEDT